MTYKIQVAEKAIKALKKLPKRDRERIEEAIDFLAIDPRPNGCKKLEGKRSSALYRIRSRKYRVVYSIQDEMLFLLVVEVGHRKEIYRSY